MSVTVTFVSCSYICIYTHVKRVFSLVDLFSVLILKQFFYYFLKPYFILLVNSIIIAEINTKKCSNLLSDSMDKHTASIIMARRFFRHVSFAVS